MRTCCRYVLIALVAVTLGACGRGGDDKSSNTTETSFIDTSSTLGDEADLETSTTLTALVVDITPTSGRPGQSFTFSIADFKPGEKVKFEVDFPNGKTFTGPERTIPSTGKLTVTYRVSASDPAGEYTVKAIGDQGTIAEGRFTVSGAAGRTTTTTRSGTTTTARGATTTTRAGTSTSTSPTSSTTSTTATTTTTSSTTTTTAP